MPKKVVMIMGVHRSGTTAVFKSVAADPSLTAFEENIDDAVYHEYRLRPRAEISPLFDAALGPILLKPLSENEKTIRNLFDEYRDYALQIVWIYRDPVNVFYSMHREGWIAATQLGQPEKAEEWNQRNRLALEMRKLFPTQTAVVRYEDLLADPQVFRDLTGWLGVKGRSLFRAEGSAGRKNLSVSMQLAVDTCTREVMQALNKERTFPAKTHARSEQRVKGIFPRARRSKTAPESRTDERHFDWSKISLPGQPRFPPDVAGLRFWVDGSVRDSPARIRPEVVRDLGPSSLSAPCPDNGPYHVACLNGKAAWFFPHEKVEQRRQGSAGILRFGAGHDWSFLVDGHSFAVFALFRPNVPCYAPYHQWRGVLLRVGPSTKKAPAFRLKWNHRLNRATAVIARGMEGRKKISVSTRVQSHPRQEWRVVSVQHSGLDGGEFAISANNVLGDAVSLQGQAEEQLEDCRDCELELGGIESQRDALFYGAIAEVAIFDRALNEDERLGLLRYLKDKYRL